MEVKHAEWDSDVQDSENPANNKKYDAVLSRYQLVMFRDEVHEDFPTMGHLDMFGRQQHVLRH